jgi:D-glycero-D-manno-heptose 1,7-bisphosphate phosphatase
MDNSKNKAIFLDRDGVINVEKNYVHRVEDFEFIEGVFELCALVQRLNFRILIITNQAGIGRGYYTTDDFDRLTEWMLAQFRARGICIEKVYYCPDHPVAGVGEYRKNSFERKPNPGMILKAKDEFDLDLSKSILVGDKDSDLEAGRAAGVRWNLKLSQGGNVPDKDELLFTSLSDITEWIKHSFGDDGR